MFWTIWIFGWWTVGFLCWYPIYERVLKDVGMDYPDNFDRGLAAIASLVIIAAWPFVSPVALPLMGVFFVSKRLTRRWRR